MNTISIGLSVIIVIAQIVTLVLAALALGGGSWIEGVEAEGDYFTRASSSYYSSGGGYSMLDGSRMHSMGMWRYFSEPGQSGPLPLRDSELTAGTFLFIASMIFGCAAVVLISYQLIGVKNNSTAMSFTIFWALFFQSAVLLTADVVVLYYFKTTFRYEDLSYSHHVSWVSFSFSALSTFLGVVKVYVTATEDDDEMDGIGSRSPPRGRPVHSPTGGGGSYHANNDYRAPPYNDYEMRPVPPKHYTPS